MTTLHLWPALAGAGVAAVGAGVLMPRWVRALPEPDEPDDDKTPYAQLGQGIAPHYAVAGAMVGGALGAALGWEWALLFLLPLAALGVALAHIDFRTRLLPKRLVLPAYPALLAVIAVVALLDSSLDAAIRAAWGWLIASGLYWCLWKFTRGMGYGDVRMSGLLGLVLGYLGWDALLLGLYAGFVVGVLGWVVLRLIGLTKDRQLPFGPFMLLGAALGIVLTALDWSSLVLATP